MAISSGVFAIPEGVRCDHFVTLDEPKCFMAQLMNHCANAWGNDDRARYWPFWNDDSVCKHVLEKRRRTVDYIPMPFKDIMAAMREWCDANAAKLTPGDYDFAEIRDSFYEAYGEHGAGMHGFQPGWGDYRNVTGWEVKAYRHPRWTGDGPLAVWKSQTDPGAFLFNSLLVAVQIATRLGYDELRFIGVDLMKETGYGDTLTVVMKAWHKHAAKHGYEWVNLSPVSRLAEFVPTVEAVA